MINQAQAQMPGTMPQVNAPLVKNKRILSKNTRNKIFIACMLAYPLLHFFIFFVIVNINSVMMTFQEFDWDTGKYTFTGFSNYITVFKDLASNKETQRTIINSLLYFPVTNFISLPLSLLFSYFLYKKVKLSGIFRVIFFLPSILPIVVLTMTFRFTFDASLGPINAILKGLGMTAEQIPSWFGKYPTSQIMIFVYCIWAGLGFNIILLSGSIARIPTEIMEYNKLEGVSMTRELGQIVIPLIWPTITTTFILGASSVFGVMLQPLLLTPGNANTMTIALKIYNGVLLNRDLPNLTTFGIVLSLIGAPIIMLMKYGMGKIFADVEY